MRGVSSQTAILCNGASIGTGKTSNQKTLTLDYRQNCNPNVRIALPAFVDQVSHLPPRFLDLLEIAAYVYCADRHTSRGRKDAVEFHKWSRSLHFFVKVRDFKFWNRDAVSNQLATLLTFLAGDRECKFTFQSGHKTPPTSLFDFGEVSIPVPKDIRVMLFSGGLDSLAGLCDLLKTNQDQVCLVSHRSGQTQSGHTQDQLVRALRAKHPNRLQHYKFHCNLTGERAAEETQRARMFLYSSIAMGMCAALSQTELTIFENGITSLNFPRRQDLLNARATRTTHPKTIFLLAKLFSEIAEKDINIETPYLWKTKTDVLKLFDETGEADLIPSAVSCSKTFLPIGKATHCGTCSQCIDRRLASYASELDKIDDSSAYAFDFITENIKDAEARTTLVDYVRQARDFSEWNPDHFVQELLTNIAEVSSYIRAGNDEEANSKITELCSRHGNQVMHALDRIRNKHDQLTQKIPRGSLLELIADREYLKPPIQRLVDRISQLLKRAIPLAFQTNPPINENDLNDKVSAILNADRVAFEREHPSIRFGLARTIPDHSAIEEDLLIETKYLRGSTTAARASDAIAADLIKYPDSVHVLFFVYDPERSITDDAEFSSGFEQKRPCTVLVIR